ncbi:MAG TPA: hypothetical protein VH062_30010 [Polyangiaceae bacterium]|jgi:hypothetical protein|nr:hypothetical protein [Polyangiaceae bacterium]
MAHGKEVHLEDNIQIGDEASDLGKKALGVGVVAIVLGAVVGGGPFGKQFNASYLVAFMYVLAIGLGFLWFVTIQHLTNAKWSVVVRRVAEIIAANMPVLALLSLPVIIPIALGQSEIYEWSDPSKVVQSPALEHKAGYLSISFFLVRIAFYFGFWSLLSRYFLKQSMDQDTSGKAEINKSLQALSAPSMIAFAITLTFCSIDLLMSIDAEFYSTIFGVYYFAGAVASAYSLLSLSLMWLQGKGRLSHAVNREHYHDLGKMMFAFGVVFWSYIAFSQFMLIWYGDLPEETHWFHDRFNGDWKIVSGALLGCHFVIPFFGLLSRHVKRNRKTLAFWAFWILIVEFVDLYWLVMPTLSKDEIPFHIADILCWIGTVGIFIGAAAMRMKGKNLVPTKDPRLADSLAFLNP